MAYKVNEIEGIGPSYAEKLGAASIETTDDLLSQCGGGHGSFRGTPAQVDQPR